MIYSIAVHPSKEKLLAFVGDKLGNLGMWNISDTIEKSRQIKDRGGNVSEELDVIVHDFKPFKKPISRIMFQHNDLTKLLMSCFDGSIRIMDFETHKFREIFVHPDEEMISHFDLCQNSNVLWISDGAGEASQLDLRVSPTKTSATVVLSEKKINTIHINPTSQNHIVIGGLDRTVKIFDVRNMKAGNSVETPDLVDPLLTLSHRLSVNSAYWDPKGVDVLSTSFDDTLGLWKDVLNKKEDGLVKIRHNNQTGRWVQKFKAVWKGQDSCHYTNFAAAVSNNSISSAIVIGNMQRTVDVYNGTSGNLVSSLYDPSLTAIPAVNVFHPCLDMIVSGNASGRMNVWC
ncbi:WD40-repeat-containing domain protein [Obelidium mucronatum]|nr:WD40-repeat-containing domain protein [Obelidium mucronatum]